MQAKYFFFFLKKGYPNVQIFLLAHCIAEYKR